MNSINPKQILLDGFITFVNAKFEIDVSGLQNPLELINFLKNLNLIYDLFLKFKYGKSLQGENFDRIQKLNQFCETYKNVLPEEFLKQAEQVDNNSDAFLRNIYLKILSLWSNLGTAYLIAQAMMYIAQWRDVVNTKREIEELSNVGYTYLEINQILMQIEILRKKANNLNQLVEEYQWSNQSNDHLLEQIRNQLKVINECHYEPIIKNVEKLKQNLESENVLLSDRRDNVSIWEKASYVGVGIGVAMSLFSAWDANRNNGVSRVKQSHGWTMTAASIGSLGLSARERRKLDDRLNLVKDRFNRLVEVDKQLAEIKAVLNKFENAVSK